MEIVCLFSGGRGTGALTNYFLQKAQYDLKIFVNGYDDGLSTGAIRKLFPGMLGPSDFRKNVERCLAHDGFGGNATAELLSYRLTSVEVHRLAVNQVPEKLEQLLDQAPRKYANYIFSNLQNVIRYLLEQHDMKARNLNDFAVGNLVLAQEYRNNPDFNSALQQFLRQFNLQDRIFNTTNGANLILVGIDVEGNFYSSESDIVSPPAKSMDEIFLLTPSELEQFSNEAKPWERTRLKDELTRRQIFPEANDEVIKLIGEASGIIYGPGTLFSSLIPSFKSPTIPVAISSNTSAKKIWISNINQDFDTKNYSSFELFQKTSSSLGENNNFREQSFVTHCLVQRTLGTRDNISESDLIHFISPILLDLTEESKLRHDHQKLGNVLSFILNNNETAHSPALKSMTIIVPLLNEVTTIERVLTGLAGIDLLEHSIIHTVLVVDSNSSDGSGEICEKMVKTLGIQYFKLDKDQGYGFAIRAALQQIGSDFVCIFPSDGEYSPENILNLIRCIPSEESTRIEFIASATRAGISTKQRKGNVEVMYKDSPTRRFLSYFGGRVLSMACGIRFNKWLSDPISGLRIMRTETIKAMNLSSNDFDILIEMIAKSGTVTSSIIEIPAEYIPRSLKDGKKLTLQKAIGVLTATLSRSWVEKE